MSNTHLNSIELFDVTHDDVLLIFRIAQLLPLGLNVVSFLLSDKLLALLDQIFRDAVFTEQMSLRANERRRADTTETQAALVELLLRIRPESC